MKANKKTIILTAFALLDCIFGGIVISNTLSSQKYVNYSHIKTSANYVIGNNVNTVGDSIKDKIDYTDKYNDALEVANLTTDANTKQKKLVANTTKKIIAAEKKAAEKKAVNNTYKVNNSGGALTKSKGVVYFNGHRETYYSQRVLPGPGLNIPGRHVASDGTVRDKNNYIVVAADPKFLAKGSIVETSLGTAKVYDCGCAYGTIDIYTDW